MELEYIQTSILRINSEMQLLSVIRKDTVLPSVDAQYAFWFKSLYYCYVAETYCA